MVGLRIVAGAVVGVAIVVGTCARADACSIALPPFALRGYPTPDEQNVPTNAIPIFGMATTEQDLSLTQIEFESASGATVGVTRRPAHVAFFELMPNTALEPSTTYTIRVTPPPPTSGTPYGTATLSFTTGTGPQTTPPAPPDVRVQHYLATQNLGSTCDPGTQGSCLFFPKGSGVELRRPEVPESRFLIFGAWFDDLRRITNGTSACLTLRARGPDGSMSDAIDVCGDDGEYLTIPDNVSLRCTDRGLERGGIPIGGSGTGGTAGTGTGGTETGGAETGGAGGTETGGTETGGTAAGGAETGGTGTGGSGNVAGAPDDPDDDGSRTVVTEACGCRVGVPANGSGPATLLALGVSLLVLRRRRA